MDKATKDKLTELNRKIHRIELILNDYQKVVPRGELVWVENKKQVKKHGVIGRVEQEAKVYCEDCRYVLGDHCLCKAGSILSRHIINPHGDCNSFEPERRGK